MQKDTLSNGTIWKGQNSFPKTWSTLKRERGACTLGGATSYCFTHFQDHSEWHGEAWLSMVITGATPHQLTNSVIPRGCQCGLPDCKATGSDLGPSSVLQQCCMSKEASSQADPFLHNSLATCLWGKTNLISWGLAWKTNSPPSHPEALEWQKEKKSTDLECGYKVDLWGWIFWLFWFGF